MTMVSLTSSRAPLPSPAHSALECRPLHCSLNPSDTLWPRAFVLSLSQAWNVLFLLIHLAHSLTTSSPCCSFSSRRPLLNALFNIKNHTFNFTPQLSQSFSPLLLNICPFLHNSYTFNKLNNHSFFLAVPCGMWDLSSPTTIEPMPPAVEVRWHLNQWTAREA